MNSLFIMLISMTVVLFAALLVLARKLDKLTDRVTNLNDEINKIKRYMSLPTIGGDFDGCGDSLNHKEFADYLISIISNFEGQSSDSMGANVSMTPVDMDAFKEYLRESVLNYANRPPFNNIEQMQKIQKTAHDIAAGYDGDMDHPNSVECTLNELLTKMVLNSSLKSIIIKTLGYSEPIEIFDDRTMVKKVDDVLSLVDAAYHELRNDFSIVKFVEENNVKMWMLYLALKPRIMTANVYSRIQIDEALETIMTAGDEEGLDNLFELENLFANTYKETKTTDPYGVCTMEDCIIEWASMLRR